MSEQQFNRLCRACVKSCKQSESARIVECPNFIKMPSDSEFRRMVDELSDAETAARSIRTRARELIEEALTMTGEDDESVDKSDEDADESE